MPFIDFSAVKEAVSFSDAIELLELKLTLAGNQFRGPCPCGKGDRRALVVTDPDGFFCQGAKVGGDVIALAAHVLSLRMRDAALELAERAGLDRNSSTSTSTSRRTVPERGPESGRAKASQSRGGASASPHPFDPARYAAGLDYEHELLIALGGDPEKLRAFGVGFSARGIHRGKIAIRVCDPETGEEVFVAVEGDISLPPQLKTTVVPFKKRA
jgi:hypothetical protein